MCALHVKTQRLIWITCRMKSEDSPQCSDNPIDSNPGRYYMKGFELIATAGLRRKVS